MEDSSTKWRSDLVATVNRRFGARYVVARHDRDRRRRKLQIVLTLVTPEQEQASALQDRAQRLVWQILGATAVVKPSFAEDELIAIDVRHEMDARLASVARQVQIERVVSAMLPGRWRAQWDTRGDRVRFEVRPQMPTRVAHPAIAVATDELEDWDNVAIPFAVDEDGNTISWRPARDPHLMVVGATGRGKTVTLHGVTAEIAARGWAVYVVDGKAVEFLGFREWPNVQLVATKITEQVALIHAIWQLMEDRYQAVVDGVASEEDFEPIVLVLDEFRDFYGNLLDWYSQVKVTGKGGDPSRPSVFEKVKSMARKGRTARVHLVLGTQRPDNDFLTGEMRDNFRARISLGRLSPEGARMMWESISAAVSVPRIRGRGVTLNDDERLVEVQSYWTPDPRKVLDKVDDLTILQGLQPAEATHERLVVVPPEISEDDEDRDEPRYRQWANALLVRGAQEAATSAAGDALRARILPVSRCRDLGLPVPRTLSAVWTGDQLATAVDASGGEIVHRLGERLLQKHAAGPSDDGGREHVVAAGADDRGGDDDDVEVEEALAGYGEVESVTIEEIDPDGGDLVLVDEDLDLWAVVETVAEDFDDPDRVVVDWRGDDDDFGSLSLERGEGVTARRPLPEEALPNALPGDGPDADEAGDAAGSLDGGVAAQAAGGRRLRIVRWWTQRAGPLLLAGRPLFSCSPSLAT